MKRNPVDRRDFLAGAFKTAGALSLAAQSAGVLSAQRSPLATRRLSAGETLKLGIVGCGGRTLPHVAAINRTPEIEVAALCDLVPAKIEEIRGRLERGSRRAYSDFEQMVRQDDLDGVLVVLPNYLHHDAAVAALEARRHVLCEKPMALSVADCNAMIAAAERHAKALQIGTQRRHSTTFQMAIEKIHSSPLGKILFSDVNTYRGDWGMQSPDPKEDSKINWRLSLEKSGGIAYEQGAHTIDLNLWILGAEPLEVSGMMGVNNPTLRTRTSPDFASFQVLFSNGAVSNYGGCVYNYGRVSPDRYFGTYGSVSLTQERLEIEFGAPRGFDLPDQNPAPVGLDLPPRNGTDRQMVHFAKVMQGLAEPTPDGYDGRRVIMVLRAAEAAARERCAVRCVEAT